MNFPFRALLISMLSALVGPSCAVVPSPSTRRLIELTKPRQDDCVGRSSKRALLCGTLSFVKTPTADVAYQRFGQGPALILIHGWPLNRLTWRNMIDGLARDFTVYAIDVPGGGDTIWTEQTDFTWPGQAQTLKSFAAALGLTTYSVLAQDSGAVIARELALIDGDRITALALCSTEIPEHRPPASIVDAQAKMSWWPPLVRMLLQNKLSSQEFLLSPEGFGSSFFDPQYALGEFRQYIIHPIVEDLVRAEGHRRFLEGWNWSRLDSLKERHRDIRMPVLLVWGEQDETFPVQQAIEMCGQFPNCVGVARVPRAKLLLHEERAEEVAAIVLPFLRGNK